MQLNTLSLLNFKNYHQLELQFNTRIICVLGENGSGKTNLLDAIYVLSFGKSYINPIDKQCIHRGEEYYMIRGKFQKDNSADTVSCTVKAGRKKLLKRNKKEYDKLSDHIGRFPVVMITPYDSNLLLGGSDERRKFIDTIISQFDRAYLKTLIGYNQVLSQRNALLKSTAYARPVNMDVLNIYDDQLIGFGKEIANKRQSFIEKEFKKNFNHFYRQLSRGEETPNLIYNSQCIEGDFEYKLKSSLDKDRATQYTNVGIHKDDIDFYIDDFPVKKFASQGQQKSYLLSLKLAYYRAVYNKTGIKPLLLLDDIFDKLDSNRVMALITIIQKEEIEQTFITDTSAERVPNIVDDLDISYETYKIAGGKII